MGTLTRFGMRMISCTAESRTAKTSLPTWKITNWRETTSNSNFFGWPKLVVTASEVAFATSCSLSTDIAALLDVGGLVSGLQFVSQ